MPTPSGGVRDQEEASECALSPPPWLAVYSSYLTLSTQPSPQPCVQLLT
jgi:hypothetical protein